MRLSQQIQSIITITLSILFMSTGNDLHADNSDKLVKWEAEINVAAGNNDFIPYYIASNRHGVLTQSNSVQARGKIEHELDTTKRFSYSYGADLIAGYSSSVNYMKYSDGDWQTNPQRPAPVWLKQLYGEVKFRGVFLTLGLKEHSSALLNHALSSGDFVESGNARPIPEARAGFIDFQNIPFTNGWLQIQGEISFGKFMDNKWLKNHYNYREDHLNLGAYYSYKRAYFRTKPTEPFSATFGMQIGSMFGGRTEYYLKGMVTESRELAGGIGQFFKMLLPINEGKEYYSGSYLGSWDINLRYRLRNKMEIKVYMQKPWEDGSGIGFMNGFDGLWGVEFSSGRKSIVNGAVVEYLDFTNHSGPMHWDPEDMTGTTITKVAEGADNYYNNYEYNSYQNYGMSIGTPFLQSPIYNTDGYIGFSNNMVRGFHLGLKGDITDNISYRFLGGYRKSWGTPFIPLITPADDTSMMLECTFRLPKLPGLKINAQIAFDCGNLYGKNIGACVTVSYSGLLKL